MPQYICNKNADDKGRHEIHEDTCHRLPLKDNQIDVGYHADCKAAILHMKHHNPNHEFDGCYYCSPACNKG